MNDEQILKQAWDKLMEGNTQAARTILLQSSTPAIQEFARRCENTSIDTAYQVRKDLEKYQRSFGGAPSEGMALKSALEQAIAKNAPPGFFGGSQGASQNSAEKPESKGCFVATACYGDYDHPAVRELRWFRDRQMNRYECGRRFIDAYYRYSPAFAAFLNNSPALARLVRWLLFPLSQAIRFFRTRNKN